MITGVGTHPGVMVGRFPEVGMGGLSADPACPSLQGEQMSDPA